MTQINLLPWRQKVKEELYLRYVLDLSKYLFYLLLIVIAINIILYCLIYFQDNRNEYLRRELGFENGKLNSLRMSNEELKRITTQLHFLYSLKAESYQAVRQLDTLAKVIPNDVTLTKITRDKNVITLSGFAKSNLQVTHLMRNISSSGVFKQPDLTEINVDDTDTSGQRKFVIAMTTKPSVSP